MTPRHRRAQRYAVYFTPAAGTALHRYGAGLLGYDVHTGTAVPQTRLPGIGLEVLEAATAEPRRYGFHATLKAPFRLADGRSPDELAQAVDTLAASHPAVAVGQLAPALLGSFVALVPVQPPTALDLLAAECTAAFDGFRAPMDEAERERRRRAGLTSRQEALLARWGYPYVFEEFRFHMTLTGSLARGDEHQWLSQLSRAFALVAEAAVSIDALTLLRQENGAPFRVVHRFPFGLSRDGG